VSYLRILILLLVLTGITTAGLLSAEKTAQSQESRATSPLPVTEALTPTAEPIVAIASPEPTPVSTPTPTPTPEPTPISTPTPTATPAVPVKQPTATPKPAPTAAPPQQDTGSSTAFSKYFANTFTTDRGTFNGRVMQFEVGPGKVRVITDTWADTECIDDCPVGTLAGYVARHNAIAGVNGTYFCPIDYSTCSSNRNAFTFKIFNPRIGRAINRDSGQYEHYPLLAFTNTGNYQFFTKWSDIENSTFPFWSGINSGPLLVRNSAFAVDDAGLDEKQRSTKATRAGIGVRNGTVFVVHISNATVPDLASAFVALGVDDALNIDAGGSSALWYNGSYKLGPGRLLPNAVVFVE
jgi:exopolysaccharide biosynthesis protein